MALCRIGGLRNPSETLALRWEDVDWKDGKVKIHSPKTAQHVGKESRIIPLFPELRAELEALRAGKTDSPFVVSRYRDTSANMRTNFARIIFRAGLEQWERVFHNLRGSRSNELFTAYPSHVAAEWMGQSCKVAMQHYLHATEGDFDRALKKTGGQN
ncbi:MAG: tyrosine-type recombinase/integrase [Thermoguttaceae bacterium]